MLLGKKPYLILPAIWIMIVGNRLYKGKTNFIKCKHFQLIFTKFKLKLKKTEFFIHDKMKNSE